MAVNLSLKQAIYQALCRSMGLSPGSSAADELIVPAYSEPELAPKVPRSRNVIYWHLEREEGAAPPIRMEKATGREGNETVTAIRTVLHYSLIIVCYGPDAEENAHRIWAMIYLDGADKPRGLLRKAGIYAVPKPPQPQLLWEPEGSRWRRRADVVIPLSVRQELETRQNGVTTVPKIIVHH